MENAEFEKSKIFRIEDEVDYVPHSIISRTIIKRPTGNIKVLSFDAGEGLAERVSPFDTFTQIIDGKTELVIDGVSRVLEKGQSVIIPAHTPNSIRASGRFKMISIVIKSGYDI